MHITAWLLHCQSYTDLTEATRELPSQTKVMHGLGQKWIGSPLVCCLLTVALLMSSLGTTAFEKMHLQPAANVQLS